MIKIVLLNGFIYRGEIVEEDEDILILKDHNSKIIRITQSAIVSREED